MAHDAAEPDPEPSDPAGAPSAARPAADARFRLVTLGRLALLAPDGSPEASLTTRRRKLAVLAFLALQRKPVPRAVLLDLFWGERDEERARASLNDALSHLRRVLGRDLIRARHEELVLDAALLPEVDALELEAAARAGDHARVIALYGGAFLSGVFVEGSTAFEDWSARERRRLEALFITACEARCGTLARARQWPDVERIAEAWLELRPASGDAALYFLNARKAAGTRDALVAAYESYDALAARLASEYGVAPERAVRELAESIREQLRHTPVAWRPAGPAPDAALFPVSPPAAAPPADAVRPSPAPTGDSSGAGAPVSASPTRLAARGWMLAAAALVLIAGAVVGARVVRTRRLVPAAAPEVPRSRPLVAVLSVSATPGDSVATWLAGVLPAMIVSRLAHAEEVEVLRQEPSRGDSIVPSADVAGTGAVRVRRGGRDGASELVLDLVIRGADGAPIARHELSAPDALTLADAAAARLLGAAGARGGSALLGELETSSVEAYQRMMDAERAAMVDGAEARRALDDAIALDSGFASALLHRYRIAQQAQETRVIRRLRPRLLAARTRASERDRLMLDADEALFAGDSARAWLLGTTLATRYSHDYLALQDYVRMADLYGRFDEAERALTRQLALVDAGRSGEGSVIACGTLVRRGGLRRERGALDAALADLRQAVAACPDLSSIWAEYAFSAIAVRRLDEARVALGRLRALQGDEPRRLVGRVMIAERRWAAIDSATADWMRSASAGAVDAARELRIAALRERGRFAEAARLEDGWRDSPDFLMPVYLDDLGRAGRIADLRRERARMLRGVGPLETLYGESVFFRGAAVRGWAWAEALYADVMLRAGDTTGLRAVIDSLAEIGPRSYYGRDGRLHHHLRGMLLARDGRFAEAERELRTALWIPAGWTRTNVELARSELALGRPGDALAALRPAYAANLDAMGRYATQSELDFEMARAFAARGQRDSAAVYAGRVRVAWAQADPAVRARLDSLPR